MKKDKQSLIDFLDESNHADYVSKLEGRNTAINELKRERKFLLQYIQQLKDTIETYHVATAPLKPAAIKAPTKKKSKGDATVILPVSDWHVEEVVKPKTVNGMNRFNPEIAEERAERYFTNALKVVNTLRAASTIETAVFPIMGDMISGYIHEELLENNAMSPAHAIFFARTLLVRGLKFWLQHGDFTRIIVPCVVGNHGRSTMKKRVSTSTDNSFETILYKILELDFQNESRVEFRISKGSHEYVNIYGVNTRIHHGDDIKGGGGVGGIAVPLLRMINKWNQNIYAHLSINGHFHTSHDLNIAVTNGSLIGPSPFSLSIGSVFEPPQQTLILIDAEYRRKVMTTPIHCETPGWLQKFKF